MIITVSGEPGAGKSTVARLLAKKLGYDFLSIGSLLRKLGLTNHKDILGMNKEALKKEKIDKELDKHLIMISKSRDNVVVDARLGFFFIKKSVKIFLKVNDIVGAKRIFLSKRKTEGYKSIITALFSIYLRKHFEVERYKRLYYINPYNTKHYDLVIDTTRLSPEEVVSIIIQFLIENNKLNI